MAESFYICLKIETISEEKMYLKVGTGIVAGLMKEEVGSLPFKDLYARMSVYTKFMLWSNPRLCKLFSSSPERP